jgi:tetratricopeptide (TPR) repeat protein
MPNTEDEQLQAAVQAVGPWLSQHPEGQDVLARLAADPSGETSTLTEWLREHAHQAPPSLATYISGGQLDRLTNIAQLFARVVIFWQAPRPERHVALYQLPPDIGDFTGREAQVQVLEALLAAARSEEASAVPIATVAGMPGVGKSTIAIHVAHRLKVRFPDAQLYVDLRGASGEARDPFDVLGGFLRDLDEAAIPADLEGRERCYRSALARKQALVVLDNAYDERQVQPLLPGHSACAVLVTSRAQLLGLAGARRVDLGLLTVDEALKLLEQLAGAGRVQAESKAARDIVKACGRLPLAVRIAGGTLSGRAKQDWTLQRYAHELADERRRLEHLRLGNLDVRASFSLSYQDLAPSEAHLFQRLGLLEGVDFAAEVATVLLDTETEPAALALAKLINAQLVEPAADDRYRLHDLLRLFAREQADTVEASRDVHLRLAQWYRQYIESTAEWLNPNIRRDVADQLILQTGEPVPAAEQRLLLAALKWFEQEHSELLAAAQAATEAEVWDLAQELVTSLQDFYGLRPHWLEWERAQTLALESARKRADGNSEGRALIALGIIYERQGRWEEALGYYEDSLRIFRRLSDRTGEGQALGNVGNVHRRRHRWDEAIKSYEASLGIFRELANRQGEGDALGNLGVVYERQKHWAKAINCYEESLRIFRDLGDRRAEGWILNNLGTTYRHRSNWDEALKHYKESLRFRRELGDRRGEGHVLGNLGVVYERQGHLDQAIRCYEESLRIRRESVDRQGEGWVLSSLGNVYRRRNRWEEAIQHYKQSIEIWRELGDRQSEGQTLSRLGVVYGRQGLWDEAVKCCEESIDICRRLGDRRGEGHALGNLAIICERQGHWDEAVKHYEESLRIRRELGDRQGEGWVLTNLGDVYRRWSRWNAAIKCHKESMPFFRELADRHREGQAFDKLDNAYRNRSNWREAAEHYKKSLRIRRELGNPRAEGHVLGNLADVYERQGHWAEAIRYYEEGLRICRELGDHRGEAQTLNKMGIIHQGHERWEEAIKHHEASLRIWRSSGNPHYERYTLGNLAGIYERQGHWADVVRCYEEGLRICRELGDHHGEAQTLNKMGVAYQDHGRWEEAIQCQQESARIFRELEDRHSEGKAVANLGDVFRAQGHRAEAVGYWQQALQQLHSDSYEYQVVLEHLRSSRWRRRPGAGFTARLHRQQSFGVANRFMDWLQKHFRRTKS